MTKHQLKSEDLYATYEEQVRVGETIAAEMHGQYGVPEELIQRYTDYIEAQVDQFDLYMDVLREENWKKLPFWKRLFTKR